MPNIVEGGSISYIVTPEGFKYEIVDKGAREQASAGFNVAVYQQLPTASASLRGTIALIPNSKSGANVYDEYIVVTGGTQSSPTYSWEKLGTFDVADLQDYSKKTHTHTVGTTSSTKEIKGSMSGIAWTGSSTTFTGKITPDVKVDSASLTGATASYDKTTGISVTTNTSGNYQPSGTVTKPNVNVSTKNTSGTATDIYSYGNDGSYTKQALTGGSYTESSYTPESYSVSDNILTITASSYTKESVTFPTITDGGVTFPTRTKVNVTAELASTPEFTGTKVQISPSTTSTSATVTGTVNVSISGTEQDVSVSGTPKGNISSQGTFSGTSITVVEPTGSTGQASE